MASLKAFASSACENGKSSSLPSASARTNWATNAATAGRSRESRLTVSSKILVFDGLPPSQGHTMSDGNSKGPVGSSTSRPR
eukprot:3392347-Lingulodinium_polyedra.AAC.1